MAKRVITELIDDLDGSAHAQTVPFAFDGVAYEVELGEANRAAFRALLEPYIKSGRKAAGAAAAVSRRRSSAPSFSKAELQAIRDWARENGHTVSDRGRIATRIVEAYQAAR